MPSLAEKTCVPCRGGVPALKGAALLELFKQLPEHSEWSVVEEHHLKRTYKFPDFKTALEFVNRIGELAEQQGHHPDILLAWGKVEVTIWTHKIDGLTESDFILAAKIDRLNRVGWSDDQLIGSSGDLNALCLSEVPPAIIR